MPNKIIPTPFEAIQNNDMKALKAWLESGGNPNAEDENGNSLVELLATRHNLEGIKILSPYNPDMSVKRNSVGEFSKNIVSLVSTGSEELRNFIDLEVAFYEEDFSQAKIILNMYPSQIKVRLLHKRDNPKYKQIIEFSKLKLKALNPNYIKHDKSTLPKYINKLDQLYKFMKCNPYFNNKLIKKFLENKIHEYNTTEELTLESFEEFENNYLGEDNVTILG